LVSNVIWYAKEAKVIIANAITTVTTNVPILDQLSATTGTASGYNKLEWSGHVKDVTVSGGERDYTPVDVLGANQLGQQGRPGGKTISFTLVYQDGESNKYFVGDASSFDYSATGSAATGTYSRYQGGEKTTGDRVKHCLVFEVTDGTNNSFVCCNNVYGVGREVSLNSDGHVEERWTLKCLDKDYYEEDNFSSTP